MCGRFYLLTDLSAIPGRFAAEGETDLPTLPAGDYVPGQPVPAIVVDGGRRLVRTLRWGLIPAWAKNPAIGRKCFNARAETLAERPSFQQAFQRRRCLVPADGFYEWTGEKGAKRAFRFSRRDRQPFVFAGLYETGHPPSGEAIVTCTIITTPPNDLVATVHDRMPAILHREGAAAWLDPERRDLKTLQSLLVPYPAEAMQREAMGPLR